MPTDSDTRNPSEAQTSVAQFKGPVPVSDKRRPDFHLEESLDEYWRADAEAIELETGDPRAEEFKARADRALAAFLSAEPLTIQGVLLKFRLALRYEDLLEHVFDRTNRYVAPRALAAVLRDLECMAVDEAQKRAVGAGSKHAVE